MAGARAIMGVMPRGPTLLLVTMVLGCGGAGEGGGPDAAPPSATCDAPALVDTATPTTVIGDGSAGSCTEAALRAAAAAGGVITFR